MAQVAINDMNPEIVQVYLKMGASGQQRIKEMLEVLILQLAQKKPEDLTSFNFNLTDFFDEEAIKLAKVRDSEIENGEVIALSHAELMARLCHTH
jgi:hypothetical protein